MQRNSRKDLRKVASGFGRFTLMGLGLSHMAQAAPLQPREVPVPLATMGEDAENAYDAAKAADWKGAATKTRALEKAARALPPRWKAMSKQFRLSMELQKLDAALQGHRKWAAMHAANRVTLLVAQLSRDFAPRVPVEVTLLDVYGRDLEIGALSDDRVYLAKAQRDLQTTWTQIRPAVVSHGGARQADIFGVVVARVQKARGTAPLRRLATPLLDEVDNLEKVFQR